MKTHTHLSKVALALLLTSGVYLSACSENKSDMTVGEQVDETIAATQEKSEEIKSGTMEMASDASESLEKAGDAVETKAGQMGEAIADTAIVAAINIKLAQDDGLDTSNIEVLVDKGQVTLKGTAPNKEAAERAESLAKNTDGVVSVNSDLTIKS